MKNIRYHFYIYCEDGGPGRVEVRAGIPGAFFTEEGEFIPFNDLGYNSKIGFYRLKLSPDVLNECDSGNPHTIHPYASKEQDGMFLWMDREAFIPHLIGTRAQCADLYQALHAFLLHDQYEADDPISSNDPVWGGDLTIDQAAERAHEFDPEMYPYDETTKKRIRQACQQYRISGVHKTRSGAWKLPQVEFERWLNDADAHKSGPKAKEETA